MKRKISALLAADIVKYSRLVADDEEQTVHRLAAYRAVFEEAASRHGGRIVNMVGDAVLAEFPSSVDAVRCAIDVQETTGQRNQAYPDDRRMQVRIGVTLADIMDQEGELFGDGVNIAARLESLAPPGGICISQTVREQVAGKLAVTFADIGEQRVKNLPSPIRAYVFAPHPADGRKGWKGLATPKGRLIAGATALVVAFAASIVAAVQFRDPGQARRWGPASLAPQPAEPRQIATRFDGEKVRTLAMRQAIPLPRNLKILQPAANVPAKLANYLGAWGGDQRWSVNGRQAILIVESIDETGTALGFYAHGAPLVTNAVTQNTARFVPFAATVSDQGLHFVWGPSKYRFILMPDGSMLGQLDTTNTRGHFDLSKSTDRWCAARSGCS
jgi:class 3 adenylate cyclase